MQFLTRPADRRKTRLAALLLAWLILSPVVAGAAMTVLNEQKIKAGLVYNFLKYTDWSNVGNKKLEVCLYGKDPLSEYLMPLQGHTAQQYPIEIVPLRTLRDAPSCNMIFVSASEEDSLPDLLDAVRGKSVLTISDINHFSLHGGMAELSMQDDQRIHLYINKSTATAAGIRIQDRLLGLAEKTGAE